jgi:hypothetical protein
LQLPFTWWDHRRFFLTDALFRSLPEPGSLTLPAPIRALGKEELIRWVVLQSLKRRCTHLLGDVSSGVLMLAGLYVISKASWLLLAILVYVGAAAWLFRPRDRELTMNALSSTVI